MLVQGETDTLFTIAEAVANYRGFVSHGAPVKLVLGFGGHSGPSAPGEQNDADPSRGYLDQLWLNWYSHYLKGSGVPTGPRVEYFRDWVPYDPNGSAQPAYGSASGWPVGTTQSWFLSGDGSLVSSTHRIEAGSQTFVNPADGVPSSYSETSGVQSEEPFNSIPPSDPPGTFAAFTSAPLAADLDSVGIPTLDFSLSATGSDSLLPATEVVLFGKIYDVAPDGSVLLVHRLVSPIRIADPSQPVHLNLPGVVHRYPAGHRLRLVLAATDQAYVGSRAPHTITITVNPSTPFRLRLPVL
jgi:predicted acyl esterase